MTDNTLDSAGFFNFTVPAPTNLVAGKTYSAVCEITVGTGGVHRPEHGVRHQTDRGVDVENGRARPAAHEPAIDALHRSGAPRSRQTAARRQ